MEDSIHPQQSLTPVELVATLNHLAAELQQQLTQAGWMRHAFLLLHNEPMPRDRKRLIDLTLGCALGADKYDSIALRPRPYPLSKHPGANLWHFCLVNGEVSDTAKRKWCSTKDELDRVAREQTLSGTLSDLPNGGDGWLLFLYRLSWRHRELRQRNEPWGRSFPPNGIVSLVGGEKEFNEWLSKKDFDLRDWVRDDPSKQRVGDWMDGFFIGERIVMLHEDIRCASLQAIQAIGTAIRAILPEASAQQPTGIAKRKQRNPGGQRKPNSKADQRIVDAWATGQYPRKEDLAHWFRLDVEYVKRLLDRNRKRNSKPRAANSCMERNNKKPRLGTGDVKRLINSETFCEPT